MARPQCETPLVFSWVLCLVWVGHQILVCTLHRTPSTLSPRYSVWKPLFSWLTEQPLSCWKACCDSLNLQVVFPFFLLNRLWSWSPTVLTIPIIQSDGRRRENSFRRMEIHSASSKASFVFIDGVLKAFFFKSLFTKFCTSHWLVMGTFYLLGLKKCFLFWVKNSLFSTWHIRWWIPQRDFVFCFFLPHFAKEPMDLYRCPYDKDNMKRRNVTKFLKHFENVLR